MLRKEYIAKIADIMIPAGPKGEPSASQSRAVGFIIDCLEDDRDFSREISSLLEGLPEPTLIDESLLKQIESKNQVSFRRLVELVYTAYYGDPAIVEMLGLPGPPQPKGYSLEGFDETLLEAVKNSHKVS